MLDMDLPSIAVDKRVEVEICTNHPDNGQATNSKAGSEPGRTSLAIGNASVMEIGNNFEGVEVVDTGTWLDVGGDQVIYFTSGVMDLITH